MLTFATIEGSAIEVHFSFVLTMEADSIRSFFLGGGRNKSQKPCGLGGNGNKKVSL